MPSGSGVERWYRSSLRQRLALTDRMTSLGMLAAGAAHEMATPLTAVVANLDHIRRALERASLAAESLSGGLGATLGHELSDALAAILDAMAGANHAAAVVRDLKTFSRPAQKTQVAIAMETVVARAVRLVSPQLRDRARVVTEFEDAPVVLGSESLLTQVFVDLLVNAGQALAATPGPDDLIAVGVRGADGEAIVEVRDTGSGIPAALLPHIFEPFFTTRSPEGGTGLGLWICRQIVSAHGGSIEVESAPGRGTRMRVRLPAHVEAAAQACAAGEQGWTVTAGDT